MNKQDKITLQKSLEAFDSLIENVIAIYGISVKHAPESEKENREATVKSIKKLIKEREKMIEVFSK